MRERRERVSEGKDRLVTDNSRDECLSAWVFYGAGPGVVYDSYSHHGEAGEPMYLVHKHDGYRYPSPLLPDISP